MIPHRPPSVRSFATEDHDGPPQTNTSGGTPTQKLGNTNPCLQSKTNITKRPREKLNLHTAITLANAGRAVNPLNQATISMKKDHELLPPGRPVKHPWGHHGYDAVRQSFLEMEPQTHLDCNHQNCGKVRLVAGGPTEFCPIYLAGRFEPTLPTMQWPCEDIDIWKDMERITGGQKRNPGGRNSSLAQSTIRSSSMVTTTQDSRAGEIPSTPVYDSDQGSTTTFNGNNQSHPRHVATGNLHTNQ
ncbi:hypothetical protein B0J11DRAFT_505395 [Dendryphion nanum]|uniref:Uncharacterized protein n=1 Tax=Dendryphion nanum TaxID=256645 RepID=A0A9P9DWQ3_9PLEO|nr:hypothetical protein B0J11DRAFT_505395 [Dendryphion nanum]